MSKMGRGRCAGCCFRSVSGADGNLYAGVEMGGRWHMTRYPVTGWDLAWFNVEPVGNVVAPDFAGAAYIEAPDLTYGGEPYFCVGISGSQYGDGSRVPPTGDSVVWYQLNYVPYSDPSLQPIAALARVFVRDDSAGSQRSDPFNTAFELTHCWIIEDDDSNPFRWDGAAKLCNYHDPNRATLVGPDYFCLQELRVSSGNKNRWTYWTPGVAAAVVTEWDNPNVVINTSGYKALYGDPNCFPAVVGTKATTITVDGGGVQTAERHLIAGIANPSSGVVSVVNEWTNEGTTAGEWHVTIGHEVSGSGIGWPTLDYDKMVCEFTDWRLTAAVADFAEYAPDDEDEEDPVYAFNDYAAGINESGKWHIEWSGFTRQYSINQRFDQGYTIYTDTQPEPPLCMKGVAVGAGVIAHAWNVEVGANENQFRVYGLTTNAWSAGSSESPGYDRWSDSVSVDESSVAGYTSSPYGSGGYTFRGGDDEPQGGLFLDFLSPWAATAQNTSTPVWAGEDNYQWFEGTGGWYFTNKPPALRWLMRYGAPVDVDDAGDGGWPDWIFRTGHTTDDVPLGYDGWTKPTTEKAFHIEAGTPLDTSDDIRVVVQGKYWEIPGEAVDAPLDAYCYAGVKTIPD